MNFKYSECFIILVKIIVFDSQTNLTDSSFLRPGTYEYSFTGISESYSWNEAMQRGSSYTRREWY